MSDENNENLRAAYQQLCASYHAIDDFRTKLLGFLPLATGTGIFFLLGPLSSQTQRYLGPIGAFGFAITFGLFCYELYGIKKCHYLIKTGKYLENQMSIPGQFLNRPPGVVGLINEPFAAGIIYPAVLAAWMFLILVFQWPQGSVWIAILVFLGGLAISVFYTLRLRRDHEKPIIGVILSTGLTTSHKTPESPPLATD